MHMFGNEGWPPFPLSTNSCTQFLENLRVCSEHIVQQIDIPFTTVTEGQNALINWSLLPLEPIILPYITQVTLSRFDPYKSSHIFLLPLLRFKDIDAEDDDDVSEGGEDINLELKISLVRSNEGDSKRTDKELLETLTRQIRRHPELCRATLTDVDISPLLNASGKGIMTKPIDPTLVKELFKRNCPNVKIRLEEDRFNRRVSLLSS